MSSTVYRELFTEDSDTARLTCCRPIRQDNHIHKLCFFPSGDLITAGFDLLNVFQLVHVGIKNPLERCARSG